MRSFALALALLLLPGCAAMRNPDFHTGMASDEVGREAMAVFPPAMPVSAMLLPDGTIVQTLSQQGGGLTILYRIEEKDGVVTSVARMAY